MKRLIGLLLCCLILSGCSRHDALAPETIALVQEEAYTLSDGTAVDLWQTDIFQDSVYQTQDGTELLRIPAKVDIAHVYVGSYVYFDTLSETAQRQIRAYYAENWPELDIPALLENAWKDFCSRDDDHPFSAHYAQQDIYPCASNDRIIAYCIETMIPIESTERGATHVRNEYFCTVFHRETGEVIGFWDLFSLSKEGTIEALARKMDSNRNQYPELKAALEGSATARLQQGGIEFCFPKGTLSWSEYDHYMYLSCDELSDILHDWAITEIIDE